MGVISAGARAERACPNEPFRTGLSATLPDCRAYEQVSPPFKDGARLEPAAMSANGSGVIVESLGNFGNSEDSATSSGSTYELTREPAGWYETALDPPASAFPYDIYLDATPDLSKTLWVLHAASQSVLTRGNLYVRAADGSLRVVGPPAPPAATAGPPSAGEPINYEQFLYTGASADFSHILFRIESASGEGEPNYLWPGDTTALGSLESLYEYPEGDTTEPKLVGVKNNGALASDSDAELVSNCGTVLGSGSPPFSGAISETGDVVFFTAVHYHNCSARQPAVNELYARVDGVKTIAISEPTLPPGEECTGKCKAAPVSEGIFQGASRDGTKVFFLTEQSLLNGDEDTTTDLYEAELEGEGAGAHVGKLVQVSHDPNAGQAAEVQGVVRVSENGSHVYFVAKGVLASNSNGQATFAKAQQGAENLYVYGPAEEPGQFKTTFIGVLCSGEGKSGSLSDSDCHSSDAELWGRHAGGPSQTTPNGDFLVFESATDLTAPEDSSSVDQVFRYDAQTAELVRVSVGQKAPAGYPCEQMKSVEEGFNCNGNTDSFPAQLPVKLEANTAHRTPLAISNDGSYVVFTSEDGLTPLALNGQPMSPASGFARNVYEYHDGNVFLISDGRDATSTYSESSVRLEGTTASGGDIFFQTADPLVPQDTDTERDLYDARIEGGFPAPPVLTPCQEEVCQ
jgi:hypothetical protein